MMIISMIAITSIIMIISMSLITRSGNLSLTGRRHSLLNFKSVEVRSSNQVL